MLVDCVLVPVHVERHDLRLDAELRRRGRFGRRAGLGLVDHGCAGLGDGFLGLRARLRLHHPRRDPELADVEVGIGVHEDARRTEQDVALAPCVLGEVLLELGEERLLVALELLPVGGREVDRVLVRRVDARDGDHAVIVHLLRELACKLDGLDMRSESASEDALEQRLDLLLDIPENRHGDWVLPRGRVYLPRAWPIRWGHASPPPGLSLMWDRSRVCAQSAPKV